MGCTKNIEITMNSDASSSVVRLNIGGREFSTTIDTLTKREPESMLAAMFSGRQTVNKDPEKIKRDAHDLDHKQEKLRTLMGYVFVDRDGKHFGHILNWLRDGVAIGLFELERLELLQLLQEAKYYQLHGFADKIIEVLNKEDEVQMEPDLTRSDIIKYTARPSRDYQYYNFRGVNLSGLDLSNLNLSTVSTLDYACLKSVNFSKAILGFYFKYVDAENANFDNTNLHSRDFIGANLRGAHMAGANLHRANLQDADLQYAELKTVDLKKANLKGANLKCANLKGANLEGANMEGADLEGANFTKANLKGANLRYANLEHAIWEGANLTGAKLLWDT